MYYRQNRYEEAIKSFKEAIRIRPDDAEAHYHLGVTYLNNEKQGPALDEYKILKALDEKLADDLFNLIYK